MPTPFRLQPAALLLAAVVLAGGAALFAAAAPDPPYSPDSWTYWSLAQSFRHGFYRIPVLRSYQTELPWSTAFPPLWPAAAAAVDALTGAGPRALLLLNGAVFVGFVAAAAAASRAVFNSPAPGLLACLLMQGDASWREELLAGRPIPFQLMLLVALLAALAAERWRARRHAAAGLLCGLMLATKFDIAPLVAIVALLLLAEPGRRNLPLFVILAALPPLPWIWFSLTHFGQLYASDGSPIAASTDPTAFTTDFRLSWHPTLRDDPVAWLRKVAFNVRKLAGSFARSWNTVELGLLAAGLLALAPTRPMPSRTAPSRGVLCLGALFVGLLASQLSYLATGFVDGRYFAPIRFLLAMAAFGAIAALLRRRAPRLARPAAAVATVLLALLPAAQGAWSPRPRTDWADPARYDALTACLAKIPPTRLLFLDDDTDASRFGALTVRLAGLAPANIDHLSPDDAREFLRRFGFGAATWRLPYGATRAQRLGAIPVPGCPNLATLP